MSYYGNNFHGKTTANGETFDQWAMTCASPTLKFGTKIKITNIENNKSVIVRVNDRGPYKMNNKGKALRPLKPHPKRSFDLSKGAFKKIANLDKGIIKVKYQFIN